MSRESIVLLLGVIVLFTPSLGIPDSWKKYILLGAGLLLILLGFLLRRSSYLRRIDRGNGERGSDSFVESDPKQPVDTTKLDI